MTLLKKSKTALPTIAAIALITLAIVGFTYAHWSETLWLNGTVNTGELDWEFASPRCIDVGVDYHCLEGFPLVGDDYYWPDPDGKNIGWQNLTLVDSDNDGDKDTLLIELHNVYPSYFTEVGFYVHNCGTIPLKVDRVIFKNSTHVVGEFRKGVPYLKVDLNGDGKFDIEFQWGDNFGVQIDPCS
ncbi:MAG: hypothetical protein QXJ11_07245, partial [Candidatus Bathyarchaeia archaeon]